MKTVTKMAMKVRAAAAACLCIGLLHPSLAAQEEEPLFLLDMPQVDSSSIPTLPVELEAAAMAMRSGEYATAAAELRDHASQAVTDSAALPALRLLTAVYLRMEAFAAAAEICERISAVDSVSAMPEVALGYLNYRLGEIDTAIVHYKAALLRDPGENQATLGLGWIHLKRRELEQAMKMATATSELAPDDALNAILIGRILTAQGFYKSAADSYRRAFRLSPSLRERYGILLQELVLRHNLSR